MPEEKEKLGTLTSCDLRAAWEHEAHNFTPWLSENLDLVSGCLGIDLDLEDTEFQVGPYRADILAISKQSGDRVIIENQLEDANLKHLGQVLAYLSGVEAKVAVWIARDFNDSVLAAIRWLNEHTSDPFGFFAVRISVVRIAHSPMAPMLEVLERPSDWQRVTAAGSSKRGKWYRDFWRHVNTMFPNEVPERLSAAFYQRDTVGLHLRVVQALIPSKSRVSIYVVGKKGETIEEYEDRLDPIRGQLDDAFREKGNEASGRDMKSSRYFRPDDESTWDQAARWLHETRIMYEEVISGQSN